MSNPIFDARDLWRSQVPYFEPDEIVVLGPVQRKVLFAGLWRASTTLALSGFSWPTIGSFYRRERVERRWFDRMNANPVVHFTSTAG